MRRPLLTTTSIPQLHRLLRLLRAILRHRPEAFGGLELARPACRISEAGGRQAAGDGACDRGGLGSSTSSSARTSSRRMREPGGAGIPWVAQLSVVLIGSMMSSSCVEKARSIRAFRAAAKGGIDAPRIRQDRGGCGAGSRLRQNRRLARFKIADLERPVGCRPSPDGGQAGQTGVV